MHCTVEGQHSARVHPNTMHISLKLYFLHLIIEEETKTNIVKNVQEETDQTIPLYSWLAVFFPHFEARWPKTDITWSKKPMINSWRGRDAAAVGTSQRNRLRRGWWARSQDAEHRHIHGTYYNTSPQQITYIHNAHDLIQSAILPSRTFCIWKF